MLRRKHQHKKQR